MIIFLNETGVFPLGRKLGIIPATFSSSFIIKNPGWRQNIRWTDLENMPLYQIFVSCPCGPW
jgi:hypothetical protein